MGININDLGLKYSKVIKHWEQDEKCILILLVLKMKKKNEKKCLVSTLRFKFTLFLLQIPTFYQCVYSCCTIPSNSSVEKFQTTFRR